MFFLFISNNHVENKVQKYPLHDLTANEENYMKKTITQLRNKNLSKRREIPFSCIKRINVINIQLLCKLTNKFNNIKKTPMA